MKNESTINLKNWTFLQHRFSCHHQQRKQSSFQFCSALLTLLMMTAELMLPKFPVLTIIVAIFFILTIFFPYLLYFEVIKNKNLPFFSEAPKMEFPPLGFISGSADTPLVIDFGLPAVFREGGSESFDCG